MKLLADETVERVEFSLTDLPLVSVAAAVISYWVPRSSWPSGVQLVLSADMVPATLSPVAFTTMLTDVRVPPVTLTLVPRLMLALLAPALGVMAIFAAEAFSAAAASSWDCVSLLVPEGVALPLPLLSLLLLVQAASPRVPPTIAAAVASARRRLNGDRASRDGGR